MGGSWQGAEIFAAWGSESVKVKSFQPYHTNQVFYLLKSYLISIDSMVERPHQADRLESRGTGMFRLNKLTDYGIVLMAHVARSAEDTPHTARSLAAATRLPLPTVGKLMRQLS